MNIIVKPMEGLCTCRPDTTWERENKDIYAIPAVEGYKYTPVIFARISKAGKCVGYKFADRYYDGFNFGVLLYGGIRPGVAVDENALEAGAGDGIPTAEDGLTWSACLDHSSILPFPLYNPLVLDNDENEFVLRKNGSAIFRTVEGSREMVENAIAEVSGVVSLRIGDIMAIELQEPLPLAARPSGNTEQDCLLTGEFLETETFRHQIFF